MIEDATVARYQDLADSHLGHVRQNLAGVSTRERSGMATVIQQAIGRHGVVS